MYVVIKFTVTHHKRDYSELLHIPNYNLLLGSLSHLKNPAKTLHAAYIPVTATNLKMPSLATVQQGQPDLVDAIPVKNTEFLSLAEMEFHVKGSLK